MDAEEFIERLYDVLYRKILDEGAWTLWTFWESRTSSDRLKKLMDLYNVQPSYDSLLEALQKPEYDPLLRRLFPFRLTEGTIRSGCDMVAAEWEEFTLKLAKTLHFTERIINRRKNVPEDMLKDAVNAMEDALKTIWCCMG